LVLWRVWVVVGEENGGMREAHGGLVGLHGDIVKVYGS